MDTSMPPPPSRAAIEGGSLVEGSGLDFKQKVDLDNDRGKTKLVDDVEAMLTAGPGYLVFGVAEEKGRFRRFEPIKGDPDAFERRLISVLLDNIDPRPIRLAMTSFEVDGGFVAVLHVPWHGRRAHQNRITGGFLTRTGARNTPLTRDEVRALFVPEEQFARDALALIEREDARCIERKLMQEDGPTFHLAVIPEERYQPGRPSFHRGTGLLRTAPPVPRLVDRAASLPRRPRGSGADVPRRPLDHARLRRFRLVADSDEAGRVFRFQAGQHSNMKPATVPI